MKRFAFILGILCFMFSFNLSVVAQNTTPGQVAAFSDVPTDHWAWQGKQ